MLVVLQTQVIAFLARNLLPNHCLRKMCAYKNAALDILRTMDSVYLALMGAKNARLMIYALPAKTNK